MSEDDGEFGKGVSFELVKSSFLRYVSYGLVFYIIRFFVFLERVREVFFLILGIFLVV